jgi:hypothetical protein
LRREARRGSKARLRSSAVELALSLACEVVTATLAACEDVRLKPV